MNDLNILATFDIDSQKYIIALKSRNIVFYRYENGLFSSKLSKEEIEICLEVLDNIAIQKETSIYLRNKKIGNNIYQIFYDTKTRLHWWRPITTEEIILEDNRVLALLYNNEPSVYYLKNINKDKKNTNANSFSLFRIVKKRIIPIAVNFTIGFLIGIPSSQIGKLLVDMNERKQAEEYRREIDDDSTYDWNKIEQAINQNSNLGQEEKEFIKKLKIIYDTDHKYMNIPMIIERLKTLQIKYYENEHPKQKNAKGAYYPLLNEMHFAYAKGINDVDERVSIHELTHLNSIYSSGRSDELATELATSEILLKLVENGEIAPKAEWYDSNGGLLTTSNSGYLHNSKLFYILLNLMNQEDRKRYLYQSDERILAEALKKIDTSTNEEEKNRRAYNLVLDFANFECENGIPMEDYADYNDKECYNELNYYYRLAFGHPIEEDFNSILVFLDDYDIGYIFKKWKYDEMPKTERLDLFYDYLDEDTSYAMKKAMCEVTGIKPMDIFDVTAKPRELYYDGTPEIYISNDGENSVLPIDNLDRLQSEFANALKKELEQKKQKNTGR